MEKETQYTKLGALVGRNFTVKDVKDPKYKKWDTQSGKMVVSDTWQEGYRKLYSVETDRGIMDLGSGQLASLLEATFKNGKADIVGQTFHVKSNGKSGIDIRYYFNLVKQEQEGLPFDE